MLQSLGLAFKEIWVWTVHAVATLQAEVAQLGSINAACFSYIRHSSSIDLKA